MQVRLSDHSSRRIRIGLTTELQEKEKRKARPRGKSVRQGVQSTVARCRLQLHLRLQSAAQLGIFG